MTFGNAPAPEFKERVEGTWGEFATPAGRVAYVLTKARLGESSPDSERRLTSQLVPVREVLQSEDLDFNQLLQRDLDDHRVAVNLIPYLLSANPVGPALFPPIVAVLLPFKDKRPADFDLLTPPVLVEENGMHWQQSDAGLQVRARRLATDDGRLHHVRYGQLWWNLEGARLVVLDGQHRAMALLAIDRTVRNEWGNGPGEKYRYFYESRVNELLHGKAIDLSGMEVPVMVTWFPELFGPEHSPHVAARKLFVDVNKEARQPSESRLILLSDSELLNIFARSLLSRLRNDDESDLMPLFSVEYDNPDTKSTTSARWSAVTNIHILKAMTLRAVFGPAKYVNSVETKISGRENATERDAFMREQLWLKDILPAAIVESDGSIFERGSISNSTFPRKVLPELESNFVSTWGEALLSLMSGLLPYRSHVEALKIMKDGWITDNAIDRLAYDALFGGVGMYWTLRDSAEHHQEQARIAALRNETLSKPDVVKAWDVISAKQTEFATKRAQIYLGAGSADHVIKARSAYQVMNTHACQVGLALTLATMWSKCTIDRASGNLVPFSSLVAGAINAWFNAGSNGKANDSRLFLNREDVTNSLNVIVNLDSPRAIEFRYFWLEVLCTEVATGVLGDSMHHDKLISLRDTARSHYLSFWKSIRKGALKSLHPGLPDAVLEERAAKVARTELKKSLAKWFQVDDEHYEAWYESQRASSMGIDDAANLDSEQSEDEILDHARASVEELVD